MAKSVNINILLLLFCVPSFVLVQSLQVRNGNGEKSVQKIAQDSLSISTNQGRAFQRFHRMDKSGNPFTPNRPYDFSSSHENR